MQRSLLIFLLLLSFIGVSYAGLGSVVSNGPPRAHIVVIGVANYRQPFPLQGPVSDARLIQSTFNELKGRIEVLSFHSLFDATREQILRTISEVADQANGKRESVIIYFSGHTTYNRENNSLVLAGIDVEVEQDTILKGIDFVRDMLSLFAPDINLLFLGDGCNIGEGLIGEVSRKYPNVVVLSASKSDEQVIDVLPKLGHSALSYYFSEGLKGGVADLDNDGRISADEMFLYIYPKIVKAVRESSITASQHPALFGRFSHRFYLAATPAPDTRIALSFAGGVPSELLTTPKVRVNGQDVAVSVTPDATAIQFEAADQYKFGPGINTISWDDERNKYLVWKEKESLSRFVVPYKNSHAILIAVDDYQPKDLHRERTFSALHTMIKQADKIGSVLELQGFKIIKLYNKDATVQKIEDTLKTYWEGGENSDVDRLFIYFGGHGSYLKDAAGNSQALLATWEYDLNKKSITMLHANDLKERHSQNIAANHVFFALDVCNSGLVTGGLGREDTVVDKNASRLALVRTEVEKKARNLLVAGTTDQEAIYDDENGGLFTSNLIEALQGAADQNRDGLLDFTEISSWVKRAVMQEIQFNSKYVGLRQEPDYIKLRAIGSGEMLFFPTFTLNIASSQKN